MREGMNESPINQLPWVVWLLTLPMIASEAIFALGRVGLIGGAQGITLRSNAIQMTAYEPQMVLRMWSMGTLDLGQAYRLLSFSFVHYSFVHALFVIVFTLALGNMVASNFRPWAVLALFFGSAIGGALIYTLAAGLLPQLRFQPLIGGYPAVYGFVGAFTFLLWTRLGQQNANRMRAFTLIGMLLLFQLVFGIIFQDGSLTWIAEIAGFGCGFLLSFVLVPGGIARVMRQIRQR